jgi:hypothetical protein
MFLLQSGGYCLNTSALLVRQLLRTSVMQVVHTQKLRRFYKNKFFAVGHREIYK